MLRDGFDMARYRKIDPRIWNDEKFRSLTDAGKLAFLFLLTHPHMTSLGAIRATPGGLGEELGWTPEAFREAFREALSKGMAEHDQKASMIALPNFIRYNPPESPNVIKAWLGALDLLPECSLKTRVVERAKAFAEGLGEAFAKALPEAFAKAMPYPEQEQEQEQFKSSCPQPLAGDSQQAGKAESDSCPHEQIIAAYHELLPMGRQVKVWSEARRTKLRARWREDKKRQSLDWWRKFFAYIAGSDFLTGRTNTSGRAPFEIDLEWIVTSDNFVKIVEGKFENREAA